MDSIQSRRFPLVCGMVGPAVFVIAFLIEGALRVDYDPMRHPVSSLSIGAEGWTQTANFLITGALIAVSAFGFRPAIRELGGGRWAPVLIALVGIGFLGAGCFVTDPINGYPPGTPLAPVKSLSGSLHDSFSSLVFLGIPAACGVLGYRFARAGRRAWATYSVVTAMLFLTGFVLAALGFAQNPEFLPIGGLFQRLTLVIGLGWIAAVAGLLLRTSTRRSWYSSRRT